MNLETFIQSTEREYITSNLGKETWIPVSLFDETDELANTHWCSFAPLQFSSEKILKHFTWNSRLNELPFDLFESNGSYRYVRYSEEGWEPIVIKRTFPMKVKPFFEVSEEFRLFFNLAPMGKSNNLFYIQADGNTDEVVKFSANKIEIKRVYLLHYMMIKKLQLIFQFEFDKYAHLYEIQGDLNFKRVTYKDSDIHFDLHFSTRGWKAGKPLLSRLIGKKIIQPATRVTLNLWHLGISPPEQFEEFTIGEDENGSEIKFSCDPDNLADFFGKNEGNPNFLTPVFFKKEVMSKYYNNPDVYSVGDSKIECSGLWILKIDNHHTDYVMVYLGDLGRDLPSEERKYWSAFNIKPEDRTISKVKFERDFMGAWSNSDYIEHSFKQSYESFQADWKKKYGWYFFKPLHENDRHHFKSLRVPTSNSHSEFDSQVLSLTKLIIDL